MSSKRQSVGVVTLAVLVGAALTAATPMASGTAATRGKPVIGAPATMPGRPLAGKRFTVSFKVTSGDTGAPLTRGKMILEPSVAGQLIRHTESFRGGTARASLVVPATAGGKLLKVKLTISAGGQTATKIATFRVQAPVPPSLSIGDMSAAEGNTGTTTLPSR